MMKFLMDRVGTFEVAVMNEASPMLACVTTRSQQHKSQLIFGLVPLARAYR